MAVTLLGLPWDAGSSYARGAAHGPPVIRSVLTSDSSSPWSLNGININDVIRWENFEDLPTNDREARKEIERRASDSIENGAVLSIGGDHSVTFPLLRAMREKFGPLNILHIDAHTDLYEEYAGNRHSHASPFARAFEEDCVRRLVQVGLRGVGPMQREFGDRHGAVMFGVEEIDKIPYQDLNEPLYVSIDLDGLDPAFAPGVSHPEPGGLSTREVLGILRKLKVKPVGADIVEYNPERDIGMITAHVAARLIKELAAQIA